MPLTYKLLELDQIPPPPKKKQKQKQKNYIQRNTMCCIILYIQCIYTSKKQRLFGDLRGNIRMYTSSASSGESNDAYISLPLTSIPTRGTSRISVDINTCKCVLYMYIFAVQLSLHMALQHFAYIFYIILGIFALKLIVDLYVYTRLFFWPQSGFASSFFKQLQTSSKTFE